MNTPFFLMLNERLTQVRRTLAKINLNRHGPVPEANEKTCEDTSSLDALCQTTANLLVEIEIEADRLYSSHALGQEVATRGNS